MLHCFEILISQMSTMNTECYSSWVLCFWFDVINEVLYISSIMIYMHSFLTLFYVYHDTSRETFRFSIPRDYSAHLFLKILHMCHDVWGNYVSISTSGDCLEQLLEEPILNFLPLCHIKAFYDNDDIVQNDNVDNTNAQWSVLNRVIAHGFESSIEPCVASGRRGFFVQNINEIDTRYICQSCQLVLREPSQLHCGHRQCHSCLHIQNDIIHCSRCSEVSATNQIWPDRAFRDELKCLSILCIVCDWTGELKSYQEHLDQNHPDAFVTCSLCPQQVLRSKIHEHYLNETHQRVLPDILLRLNSTDVHEMVSIALNDATISHDNLQRISNALGSHEMGFQVLVREFPALRMLAQESENDVREMRVAQSFSDQEIQSLQQRLEGRQIISFDGILHWKMSDVRQKMDDAQFERKKSIYSPDFYSSPIGYKMCSRLFLNGINNARDTHLSIFFVLKRGEYDAILQWPFHFKVTFSLLDQSTSTDHQRHFSDFFWSDTASICFQRPRSEMNEAYGIEKFFSLDQFQHRYIQNDTMCVKVEVDFTTLPPTSPSDSGNMLVNDEQHTDLNDDNSLEGRLCLMENSDRVQ